MANQFTPRELAHSVAIDALFYAIRNADAVFDNLTASERAKVVHQMDKLRNSLADKAKLDIVPAV